MLHLNQLFDFDNVDVYFLLVNAFNLLRNFSISEPPLPITIPGLPVWIAILIRFAARSISTLETEASFNASAIYLRTFKSSCKSVAKSLPAYHFASQSRITPTRSPIGLIFDPLYSLLNDLVNYASLTSLASFRQLRL